MNIPSRFTYNTKTKNNPNPLTGKLLYLYKRTITNKEWTMDKWFSLDKSQQNYAEARSQAKKIYDPIYIKF